MIKRTKKIYFKTSAGIICDSGAASISDCQVLVEFGMIGPKSKNHSKKVICQIKMISEHCLK